VQIVRVDVKIQHVNGGSVQNNPVHSNIAQDVVNRRKFALPVRNIALIVMMIVHCVPIV
jgi:hypothetical protein